MDDNDRSPSHFTNVHHIVEESFSYNPADNFIQLFVISTASKPIFKINDLWKINCNQEIVLPNCALVIKLNFQRQTR